MPARPSGDELVELVLAAVRQIPSGSVMSYGDVAEFVGYCGPRFVGRVLAQESADVPWQRVLRADGTCAPHIRQRQLELLAAEGVPIRGERVLLRECRWDGRSR